MEIEEGVIRRGRRPRRITRSEISIILHMVRKPRKGIQNKKKDQKVPLNKLKLNLQRPPIKWLPPIQRPVIKDPK